MSPTLSVQKLRIYTFPDLMGTSFWYRLQNIFDTFIFA